jgi:predicted TIM-barrel fold metal-dependent hydrolase
MKDLSPTSELVFTVTAECTPPEEMAVIDGGQARMIRKVGVDNCLFETDFPHPTSLYPIENLEARLGDLNADERAKVLGGNAARLDDIAI